jgi:hypothetical protein
VRSMRTEPRLYAMIRGLPATVNFDDPFDRGVRAYRLSRNPAGGVNLPRAAKTEKRYRCAEQVADLADAAGPGRLVVLALACTGLRRGELAALRFPTQSDATLVHADLFDDDLEAVADRLDEIHARVGAMWAPTTVADLLSTARAADLQVSGWRRRDLNPQPPPCKGGALPVELRPPTTSPAYRRRPHPFQTTDARYGETRTLHGHMNLATPGAVGHRHRETVFSPGPELSLLEMCVRNSGSFRASALFELTGLRALRPRTS